MQILARHNQGTIELSQTDRNTSHWIRVEFGGKVKWEDCHFCGFITQQDARMMRLEGHAPCFIKSFGWRSSIMENWQDMGQNEYIAGMYSRWSKPGHQNVFAIVEDSMPLICEK